MNIPGLHSRLLTPFHTRKGLSLSVESEMPAVMVTRVDLLLSGAPNTWNARLMRPELASGRHGGNAFESGQAGSQNNDFVLIKKSNRVEGIITALARKRQSQLTEFCGAGAWWGDRGVFRCLGDGIGEL